MELPSCMSFRGSSKWVLLKLIGDKNSAKYFKILCPGPDFSAFWLDVGRFLARANFDPSDTEPNSPVQVSLAYNWVTVGDMNHYEKQSALKEPSRSFTFFIYRVKPEDLK